MSESNPTGMEMIEAYLREHGFGGLYTEDCGCRLDDFAPCDRESIDECRAGFQMADCGGWIIGPASQREEPMNQILFENPLGLIAELQRLGWAVHPGQITGQPIEIVRWQAPEMKRANPDPIVATIESALEVGQGISVARTRGDA